MQVLVEAKTAEWVRSKDHNLLLAIAQDLRDTYGKEQVSWTETAKTSKDEDMFSIMLKVVAKNPHEAAKQAEAILTTQFEKHYGKAMPPRMRYIGQPTK